MNTGQMTVIASYPAPGPAPRGLAWDGESLWHADEQVHRLFKLDACDLHAIESFPLTGEPRGLAWDGRHLWLTDNHTKAIQPDHIFHRVAGQCHDDQACKGR